MRRVQVLSMLFTVFLFLPLTQTLPALGQNQKPLKPATDKPALLPPANDDEQVVSMMKKGLDDDIIVAKIKASNWTFRLSDEEMLSMRKLGLSARVIAVMIDHMVLNGASVVIDDKRVDESTLSQAKTGGRLLNNLTGDMTPLRENAFLEGPTAATSASPMPEIKVTVPKGDSINNYVLVQMRQKIDRREIEVSTGSGISNSRSGVQASAVRKTIVIPRGNNTYQLLPDKPLKHGAYMVYVVGSADERKDIYAKGFDFSVLN